MIYKMIKLDSLSVYWNSQAQFYTKMEREKVQAALKTNIASQQHRPDYRYCKCAVKYKVRKDQEICIT